MAGALSVVPWSHYGLSAQVSLAQVGLFAEEVGLGPRRLGFCCLCKHQVLKVSLRFLVDTFAHFALAHAPQIWPQNADPCGHWYEAIVECSPEF